MRKRRPEDRKRVVSRGKFCDYCTCPDCQSKPDGSEIEVKCASSLKCADGTNICTTCYHLDPCGHGCQGGSPEQPCSHKPKLA